MFSKFFDMIKSGQIDQLKEFLNTNPDFDVNYENYREESPMDIAIIYGQPQILQLLVEKGATSNNNKKYTPLHNWITTDLDEDNLNEDDLRNMLVNIMKSGADINSNGLGTNSSPIHLGCNLGRLINVSILLEYRPNIFIKDENGMTPLDILKYDLFENPDNAIYRINEKIELLKILRAYEKKVLREQTIFMMWPVFSKKISKDLIGRFVDYLH